MRLALTIAVLLGALLPVNSAAGIITFGDRASFNAHGGIAFNSNFNDLIVGNVPNWPNGYDPSQPPFARGDVTYTNPSGYILAFSLTGTTEVVLGEGFPGVGLFATLASAPKYTMFGFDVGAENSELTSIAVVTTVATYIYRDLRLADTLAGQLEFRGFIASPDEYITSVVVGSCWTMHWRFGLEGCVDYPEFVVPRPRITNVAVGNIPEPESLLLLGTTIAALARRRYQSNR